MSFREYFGKKENINDFFYYVTLVLIVFCFGVGIATKYSFWIYILPIVILGYIFTFGSEKDLEDLGLELNEYKEKKIYSFEEFFDQFDDYLSSMKQVSNVNMIDNRGKLRKLDYLNRLKLISKYIERNYTEQYQDAFEEILKRYNKISIKEDKDIYFKKGVVGYFMFRKKISKNDNNERFLEAFSNLLKSARRGNVYAKILLKLENLDIPEMQSLGRKV